MLQGLSEEILASLVTAGFSRLRHTLEGISTVERAFLDSSGDVSRDVERRCRHNLEVALSRLGAFDIPMAEFLQDLRESGLFQTMVLVAIVYPPLRREEDKIEKPEWNTRAPGVLNAFRWFFEHRFGTKEIKVGKKSLSAAQLFESLLSSFHAAVWHADPVQASRLQADYRYRDIIAELRSLNRNLEKQFDASNATLTIPPITPDLLDQSHRAISERILGGLTYIDIHGPKDRLEKIELDRIYVNVPIVTRSSKSSQQSTFYSPPQGTDASDFDASFTVDDVLRHFKMVVLLGHPGSGKSTIVQKLCHDMALRNLNSRHTPLPIRVVVRHFEAMLKQNPKLSLLDYIVADLLQQTNLSDAANLRATLLNFLVFGRAVIFFDGLDEILTIAHRREFVNFALSFTSTFPLCAVFVTSRIVGYQTAPLPRHFKLFFVTHFDDGRVTDYFKRLAQCQFAVTKERSLRDADDFLIQTKDTGKDLRSNPLLLSLMTWLYYETRGNMPTTRADVYSECSLLMFEKWDRHRNIRPDLPEGFRIAPLLAKIAEKMYLDPALGRGVNVGWLRHQIREYFANQYQMFRHCDDMAERDAEKVLEFITGRAWILTDKGLGVYDFTHRTFLEYYFACQINNKYEGVEELATELCVPIAEGRWNVPAHLALQLKIGARFDAGSQIAAVFCGKLPELCRQGTPTTRLSVIEFLRECLDYMIIEDVGLYRLAGCYWGILLEMEQYEAHLPSFVDVKNPKLQAIFGALAALLSDSITRGRFKRLGPCFDWLRGLRLALGRSEADADFHRAQNARGILKIIEIELRDQIVGMGSRNLAFTKLAFDLFDQVLPDCDVAGGRLWEMSVSQLGRNDWLEVDFFLIAKNLLFKGIGIVFNDHYVCLFRAVLPQLAASPSQRRWTQHGYEYFETLEELEWDRIGDIADVRTLSELLAALRICRRLGLGNDWLDDLIRRAERRVKSVQMRCGWSAEDRRLLESRFENAFRSGVSRELRCVSLPHL